jgi:AraC family transcriptional regulator
MQATVVRSGELMSVIDCRCSSGPHDRPFVERHTAFSVSYVWKGSFGYRLRGRSYELVAGSLLIGRQGDDYVCTHEHAQGDECLSFQLAPALVETIGGPKNVWRAATMPPLPDLMVLGELAQATAEGGGAVGGPDPLEVGLLLTGRFVDVASGGTARPIDASALDRRRAVEAALWMDTHPQEPVNLALLSRATHLSPFHFLRLFSGVLGVTPHQYLIRSRMRHAARLLASGSRPITDVALDVGFGDLSNFVRTFRRAAGVSPRAFRRAATGDRKIFQERIAASV